MNKMLVAVFENEASAYEGLSALKELHQHGDITLYATAVISKDNKGELQIKDYTEGSAIGTATGVLAGSLIGLIGGPIGVSIGATSGFLAGLLFDMSSDDINIKFVDEVSGALAKEKTAVIAEIDETWTVPIDTKLTKAMVFRRLKNEVFDEQLTRESKAIEAEYQKLKDELVDAGEQAKSQIKSALAKLQDKAALVNDQIKRRLDETRGEFETKITAMQDQMKAVKERRKARLEKRLNEVKEEYRVRTQKLKEASKLISEALRLKERAPETESAHTH